MTIEPEPCLRVIHSYPPNNIYDRCVAKWPTVANRPGIMFCYGPAIYRPKMSGTIDVALMAHEAVHAMRQDNDPDGWWDRYLIDDQFRFYEELLAHRREFEIASHGKPRPKRRYILNQIAKRLSGPMYGNVVITEKAKRLIKVKTLEDV